MSKKLMKHYSNNSLEDWKRFPDDADPEPPNTDAPPPPNMDPPLVPKPALWKLIIIITINKYQTADHNEAYMLYHIQTFCTMSNSFLF